MITQLENTVQWNIGLQRNPEMVNIYSEILKYFLTVPKKFETLRKCEHFKAQYVLEKQINLKMCFKEFCGLIPKYQNFF